MRRVLPSVIAFVLGVLVTVGAYETTRPVRDTRKVLSLASGAPSAPSDRDAPPPPARTSTSTSARPTVGARPAPTLGADKATDATSAAREARRVRMQRLLERREELGLTGAPPRTPREARRELIKATLAEQRLPPQLDDAEDAAP